MISFTLTSAIVLAIDAEMLTGMELAIVEVLHLLKSYGVNIKVTRAYLRARYAQLSRSKSSFDPQTATH